MDKKSHERHCQTCATGRQRPVSDTDLEFHSDNRAALRPQEHERGIFGKGTVKGGNEKQCRLT